MLKLIGWLGGTVLPCVGLGLLVFEFLPQGTLKRSDISPAPLPASPLPVSIAKSQTALAPKPSSNAFSEPKLPTIVIDPGHGGADDGAKGNGLKEKNMTLDVARRVNRMLMKGGFSTVMTRDSDVYVSLADRVAIADASPDSLFVSIHFNQSSFGYVNGVETYYADAKDTPSHGWPWLKFLNVLFPMKPADKGERFASCMQHALVDRMLVENRGIKSRDLYVVHHTKEPAILVEPGFISNAAEAKQLNNPTYRERLAAAIVSGIIAYQRGDDPHAIQMVRK